MACMSDLGFTSRARAGGSGSHPGRRKVRRPIPQAILPRECTKCSLLRIPELCCFTAGGISQAGSANGSGRSLRRVGPGPGGIRSSLAGLWLHTGYIVKLLDSVRQTSVSASTSDSIQATLVSGRLVSHVTYLWTPSDATRNFHGRGAALDLKRFGVHGHVRVLLDVKVYFHVWRLFFSFFLSSCGSGWLAGGHVPEGREGLNTQREDIDGFDTSQWLGTRARSVMMANWTSRGGRRYRMVMVRVLVFFLICGSGIMALPRGNEIHPEGLPGRRSRLRILGTKRQDNRSPKMTLIPCLVRSR